MAIDLPSVIDGLGKAFEEFKSNYDRRLSDIERVAARPTGPQGGGAFVSADQKQHLDAFTGWLRAPRSHMASARLADYEGKAASGLTDAAGGAAVPEVLVRQIIAQVKDGSPMRRLANVVQVSSGDAKMVVNRNDATSGWVGETGTRSATNEPTLLKRVPTFGTVYSLIAASEELMHDAAFDVASWFSDAATQQIIAAEGTAFLTGDGSDKPTGILNTAPSAAGDSDSPPRAVTALQYLATGVGDGFGTLSTASPEHFPADVLYQVVYSLKADYRRNAVWLMNSATAGTIRRFKDAEGRYLWTDPLSMGQPPLLCGYPVEIAEQMPDIGANTHPVLFGDFRRGYGIFDAGGLRVTIDDNVTTPGTYRLYIRRRCGGIILDHHAVRAIKCAVS